MMKSISLHYLAKDKSKVCVVIRDLLTGANKVSFICSLDSVADIVKCNLDENINYDYESIGMKPEKIKGK